jgi:hypothetical protein
MTNQRGKYSITEEMYVQTNLRLLIIRLDQFGAWINSTINGRNIKYEPK